MKELSYELYGLHSGRMTPKQSAAHNGGWYNGKGEKIGWGDLDYKDLWDIGRKMKEDESFIVLSESDSYWKFVSFPERSNPMKTEVAQKEQNPGLEYVASRARILVRNQEIFLASNYTLPGPETKDGIHVIIVTQEEMKRMVLNETNPDDGGQ